MVCPVMNKQTQAEATSEYPYQSIYRPWSWILSSSTNLLLFAAVVGLAWMLYKRRKAKGKRQFVTLRSVQVNKTLLESEDLTKVNVLVTGGSGMLGKEIVSCLLKDGRYKVHSLDLFIPEEENRNSEVCSYIQTDVTNLEDLCISTKGMDAVFHTAAILPMAIGAKDSDFDEVNLKGTENVISACKECKVKRLIYTSSVEVVCGNSKEVIGNADENYPFPEESMNAYVRTKRCAEKAVLAANGESDLTTCAVRPGGIMDALIQSKLERPFFFGENGLTYSIVACEDVAQLHVLIDQTLVTNKKIAGKVYIAASTVSERELAETIATELGDGQRAESTSFSFYSLLTYINVICYKLTGSVPIGPSMTLMVLGFIKSSTHTFSSALAQRELGWKPTPWKDTLKKLVKQWKETKKDK